MPVSPPMPRRVAASVLGLTLLLAGPAGAADGSGASLFDGRACDLLLLEELDALGPLVYDDASPGLDTCRYASSDGAGGHRVELSRSSATLEDMRNFFAGGEDLTISGHDAYASAGRLGVQTDEGLLEVVASLGDDAASAGLDVVAYETAIAEVILARLAGVAVAAGDAPADLPTSARTPCEAISLGELNAIASLEFVEVFGAETTYCEIYSDESDGGYWLGLDWTPGGLDQVAGWVDDAVEIEIAGLPALTDHRTVWVAKGDKMLQVVTSFGGREATEGVDPSAFAAAVAEIIVPRLIDE